MSKSCQFANIQIKCDQDYSLPYPLKHKQLDPSPISLVIKSSHKDADYEPKDNTCNSSLEDYES